MLMNCIMLKLVLITKNVIEDEGRFSKQHTQYIPRKEIVYLKVLPKDNHFSNCKMDMFCTMQKFLYAYK